MGGAGGAEGEDRAAAPYKGKQNRKAMWVMTLCEDYKCVTFWDVILDKEVTLQRRIRDNESLKCYLAPHMHFKNNPKAQEKVNSIKEILHKWREIQ